MPETQEMLDFCAGHGIRAEIELVTAKELDQAYDRLTAGDVRYRFVLDTSTIAEA
jgi:alcohol dehydrogenase (NADP+)